MEKPFWAEGFTEGGFKSLVVLKKVSKVAWGAIIEIGAFLALIWTNVALICCEVKWSDGTAEIKTIKAWIEALVLD